MNTKALNQPTADVPRLLKTSDAARMLNVSVHTLRVWVGKGLIPAIRVNGQMRFRLSSLQAALDKMEAQNAG